MALTREQELIENIEFLRTLVERGNVPMSSLLAAEKELQEWRLRNEFAQEIEQSVERQIEEYDESRERNLNPNYDELQSLRERRNSLVEEIENRKAVLSSHGKDYWQTGDGKVMYERHIDAIRDCESELPSLENQIEQLLLEPRDIYEDRGELQVYDPYEILTSQEREQMAAGTFALRLTSEEERLKEEERLGNERAQNELEREFLRQQRQEIYDFLNTEQYSNFDVLVSEAERKIESEIFEGQVTLSQEQELQGYAQRVFDNSNLNQEQLERIDHLTGREQIGLAALISGSISGGLQIGSMVSNQPISNAPSLYSKWIGDTAGLAMIGNVIYRARKQAEDGLDVDEIMLLVSDGTRVVVSAGKIVLGWAQVAVTPGENGESFWRRLGESYTTASDLNPRVSKPTTNVLVDADLKMVSTVSNINIDNFMNTPDEVLAKVFEQRPRLTRSQSMPNLGGDSIPDIGAPSSGTGGTHLTHSQSMPDLSTPETSVNTGGSKTADNLGKASTALSLVADVAWLTQAAQDLSDEGGNPDASKIMNVIGAGLSVVGDIASFAGPIGEIVGTIIGGVGCAVAALGGICDLGPSSSKEEVMKAVSDFALAFGGGLMPNVNSIEQAIKYQYLKDNADNDIDKEAFGALHKISALDSTPLVSFFHGAYDDQIRREAREELLGRYGSFDNMMKEYIINNSDFQNNLNNAHKFLKENSHTDHTQFLTAYLTPTQIEEIFGTQEYYKDGYDVRSIQDNLQVKVEEEDGSYTLKTRAGVSVLPTGANLKNIDGREVLDTISLGYGEGKETIQDENGNQVQNPRVIDTATQISYNKKQLEMFSEEFKDLHREWGIIDYTSGGCLNGACGLGQEAVYGFKDEPNPRYHRFKCWIDVVDDMSGETVQDFPENFNGFDTAVPTRTLPAINNRVISTVSDIIFLNAETKAGDDDVILTNVERVYNDGTENKDSVVRAKADGGEGMDILDVTNLKEDGIDGFNFQYSIRDNHFSYDRQNSDGKNYDLDFYNFEQIRLGKDLNNRVTIKDGSDVTLGEDDTLQQIGIVGTESKTNNVDFSGVTGKKLYFAGAVDGENTVKGTENSDTIVVPELKEDSEGTGFANINGGAGNDFILGGNFKNSIESQRGNTIHGGDGTDYIKGDGSYNLLYGDSGNDVLQGSNKEGSYNELFGGEGNDILVAGNHGSILRGESGNDVLMGKDSADELYGDSGSDYILGGKGNDKIYGDIGNDYIQGETGNDHIYGGEGNDYLKGNEGQDTFYFGDNFGNDVIADYEQGDIIKFEGELGLPGNDMLSVKVLKSEEKDFLALVTSQGCLKIKGVDSADYLSIQFGNNLVDSSEIQGRIDEGMTFEEYSSPFLPVGEESQIATPSTTNPLSYSTENQYTEAFSGNNLETSSNPLVS